MKNKIILSLLCFSACFSPCEITILNGRSGEKIKVVELQDKTPQEFYGIVCPKASQLNEICEHMDYILGEKMLDDLGPEEWKSLPNKCTIRAIKSSEYPHRLCILEVGTNKPDQVVLLGDFSGINFNVEDMSILTLLKLAANSRESSAIIELKTRIKAIIRKCDGYNCLFSNHINPEQLPLFCLAIKKEGSIKEVQAIDPNFDVRRIYGFVPGLDL